MLKLKPTINCYMSHYKYRPQHRRCQQRISNIANIMFFWKRLAQNFHRPLFLYNIVCSVEQYYNTVIVIDYQLQIPLHFGSTAKTEPCECHFNLLTQSL